MDGEKTGVNKVRRKGREEVRSKKVEFKVPKQAGGSKVAQASCLAL